MGTGGQEKMMKQMGWFSHPKGKNGVASHYIILLFF
jgi:hypothetical protein